MGDAYKGGPRAGRVEWKAAVGAPAGACCARRSAATGYERPCSNHIHPRWQPASEGHGLEKEDPPSENILVENNYVRGYWTVWLSVRRL